MMVNSTQATVRVTSVLQQELQRMFSEGEPFGGKIPAERVQHRVGSQVVLDGFSDVDGTGECEGLVWLTVLRRYRTSEFPVESFESGNCSQPRAVLVQLGVARCSATMTDDGGPPNPDDVHMEAIRGLDDSARLDRALCAAADLLDEQGMISGWAADAAEPVGPEGGVITWVQQAAFRLA